MVSEDVGYEREKDGCFGKVVIVSTTVIWTGYTVGNAIIVTDRDGKKLGRGLVGSDKTFMVNILKQAAYITLHVVETHSTKTSKTIKIPVHSA